MATHWCPRDHFIDPAEEVFVCLLFFSEAGGCYLMELIPLLFCLATKRVKTFHNMFDFAALKKQLAFIVIDMCDPEHFWL